MDENSHLYSEKRNLVESRSKREDEERHISGSMELTVSGKVIEIEALDRQSMLHRTSLVVHGITCTCTGGGSVVKGDTVTVEALDRQSMLHRTTNLQTIMHLLKCMVGTGILAMPNAFLSAGLWFGTVITLVIGVICLHCMNMLVTCTQTLCRRHGCMALGYGGAVSMSFKTGPKYLTGFARYGE